MSKQAFDKIHAGLTEALVVASGWNADISAAPRDSRVWLASECGKVSPTYWNEKRKAWSGFGDKEQPVAWYPYFVPVHPFAATQGEAAVSTAPMNVSLPGTDERSGEGANAGGSHEVTGSSSHPQPSAVEPVSSSTEFAYLEDVGSGA